MNYIISVNSEFEYIVRSFEFVAHMFNSGSGYIGVIFVMGVLGIFFGGLSAVASQGNPMAAVKSWIFKMVISGALIASVVGSKTTIVVECLPEGKMKSIGGIPTVMAAVAYSENIIERTITDAIVTVMSPILPYDVIGKGKGFELLANADNIAQNFFSIQPHTKNSLDSYYKMCVVKDTVRNWIPIKSLHSTNDLWGAMKSNTIGYGSIVYTASDSQGQHYPCSQAYEEINKQFTTAQIRNALEVQCAQTITGDNATKTNEVNKCVSDTGNIVQAFLSGSSFSIDINSYLRSQIIAEIMQSSTGVRDNMLTDMNKKNFSSAIMAESMIPRLKGVLYGMIIGIFPLLMGFIWFNPMKTIMFYGGMLMLIILWSAIDTFMDMQYQHEVYNMFRSMQTLGLGFNQMFDIQNKAAEAVALYGQGRWMALGLSAAIVTTLTGVSAYAMSTVGSQLASSAQGAAAANAGYLSSSGDTQLTQKAGQELSARDLGMMPNYNASNLSTQHNTSAIEGMWNAQGKFAGVGNDYNNLGNMSYNSGVTSAFQNMMNNANVGASVANQGGIPSAVSNALYNGGASGTNIARTTAAMKQIHDTSSNFGAEQSRQEVATHLSKTGRTDATHEQASAYNMGIAEFSDLQSRGYNLSEQNAQALNEKYGTDVFQAGQTINAGVSGGRLDNVQLSNHVNDNIGGYDVNGTNSAILDDNMQPLSNSFNGIVDGYSGNITTDGDGNIVNVSGQQGSSFTNQDVQDTIVSNMFTNRSGSDISNVDRDTTTHDHGSSYSNLLQSVQDGNSSFLDDIFSNGTTDSTKESQTTAIAAQLANEISPYYRVTENQNWGTDIGAGVNVAARMSTGEQGLGWLFEKATGVSGEMGVSANANISKQDRTNEEQNLIASDIRDIISNAESKESAMQQLQSYANNAVNTNLSPITDVFDDMMNGVPNSTSTGVSNSAYEQENSEEPKNIEPSKQTFEDK